MNIVAAVILTLALQTPTDLLKQAQALIDQAILALSGPAPTQTIVVPAGGNLQAAIDTMTPGVTIVLDAGATYKGRIVLKGGPGVITTKGASLVPGVRVTPASAAQFAKVLVGGGGDGSFTTAPGAHDWTLAGIEATGDAFDIVNTGSGTSTTVEATGILLDHVYIHGNATTGAKRGVNMNAGNVILRDSYVSDIFRKGQDTQAVGGTNGPGPYLIDNNYLEASGENIMFGGSDPHIPGLIPTDIEIRKNYLAKPLAWRGVWTAKNLMELKNAQHVMIHDNVAENSWADGQEGYALVLSIRNQSGGCPWCVVQDVTVSNNTWTHAGGGINILARDDAFPSGVMNNIHILFNKFLDINRDAFGGVNAAGRMILLQGGGDGLEIRGNEFQAVGSSNSFMTFDQPQWKWTNLQVLDNVFPEGKYGIVGGGGPAIGKPTLDFYAPNYLWSNIKVLRTVRTDSITYPVGTTVIK